MRSNAINKPASKMAFRIRRIAFRRVVVRQIVTNNIDCQGKLRNRNLWEPFLSAQLLLLSVNVTTIYVKPFVIVRLI